MSSRYCIAIILSFLGFVFFAQASHAISYSLIPPSGALTQGQEVQFTITINTQGTSVTSSQIGMTYQTQYLQYVSTIPGSAMSTVAVQQGTGNLVFTGSNSSGFNGNGNYAIVTFKIIATAPGSTDLCVLYAVTTTPTPGPQTTPLPTIPQPTSLPKTGSFEDLSLVGIIGMVFVVGAGIAYMFLNHTSRMRS